MASIFAAKVRAISARGKEAVQLRELMLEGILSIAEGVNQKLIRIKLDAYLGSSSDPKAAIWSKGVAYGLLLGNCVTTS